MSAPAVEIGPEVEEIETEHLGFKALSQGGEGPKKLKLLPEPWPTDNVPPASATLLSIASKPGLLAAASPKNLIITSTEKVRKSFEGKAGNGDVVSDFQPEVNLDVPRLRHVVFSTDGDFLVISAEEQGGLAVFDTAAVVKSQKKEPELQIATDQSSVRALLPNPTPELSHSFALVLDSGKLLIANVAEGTSITIKENGVNCVAWSTKGKAVVAGLQDGTVAIYMAGGAHKGTVPRPPEVDNGFSVSGLTWLDNETFLIVHSQKHPDLQNPEDSKYHMVKSNKGWTSFTFHPFPYDPLLISPELPQRSLPTRFSTVRLRKWEPELEDMLIMSNSHTDTIAVLALTTTKISPYQEKCGEFMMTAFDDTKKAAVPRTVLGEEEADSALIGEALDLSSTEKIPCPVPALVEEGITENPWPLPMYMTLTHEGLLSAWWVVWNRSIEKGTRYSGLTFGSEDSQSSAGIAAPSPQATTTPSKSNGSIFGQPSTTPASNNVFGKPSATFGTPQPAGGSAFGSATPGLMKPTPPGFGTPAFGSTTPAFGKPSQPAQPAFGKPSQPAFGSTSTFGSPAGGSAFGAAGGMGAKPSPWGGASQQPSAQANPFASGGASSGFANLGQKPGTTAGGSSSGFANLGSGTSSFSSFGSNPGGSSGFASLGQNQQKSGFGALKTEPSFGSTVTVASNAGSTLPSWGGNTPAQQGSIFGQQSKSSFNTSSFESKSSDMSDADRRQRDEATPTPQPPPQQSGGLFGLAGGFKLGTTFTSDGTAKDDPAKPAAAANGSFFGSDFANTLGASKLPTTPAKEAPQPVSTTPASPPKQKSLFSLDTPAKESQTPKLPPPAKEKSAPVDDAPLPPDWTATKKSAPVDDAPLPPDFVTAKKPKEVDDAPLPPDFITAKPSKKDDDLPPLAGSPGIEVEAPSSPVELSPSDNDGFSSDEADEEEEEEEEEEEDESESPEPTSQTPAPKAGGWSFQNSVNQSPQIFPPAPTPPVIKSGATSTSGRSASPAPTSLFGKPSQPSTGPSPFAGSSLFGQQPQKPAFGLTSNAMSNSAKTNFPPPASRAQAALRSPSPVRSASTSALAGRRPSDRSRTPLSASIQPPKPPTPQLEVSDLEDQEDDRVQEQLAKPIEPSRKLEDFVAYQNYTDRPVTKTGHAAQIEMIYKDINGMLDVLGWNSRFMKSYLAYHVEPQPNHNVDRNTLVEIMDEGEHGQWFENFTLCEIEVLKVLEDELEQELDEGRVQDVFDKLAQLARLLRDKAKLMTRLNDIRRQIISRKDPEKTEALRKAPLSKELADGQKSLRSEYAQLLTALHKAEEAAAILRSRVTAQSAQNGKTGAMPTMDNVKKTIIKMNAMAEKKNNDVILLESKMQKIGLGEQGRPSSSSSRTAATPRRGRGTGMRNSVAESPLATPPTNRSRMSMSLSELKHRALTPDVEATPTPSKGYGLFYTPEGSPNASKELAHIENVIEKNMDNLRETARKRKTVSAGLKKALVERGVKTTKAY